MKGRRFGERLGFAWCGLRLALRRERSLRLHAMAVVALGVALLVLKPSMIWCALLGLAAGLVLVAELLNSALETLADRVHPERHPDIGVAKDIAAGAVLVASVLALGVALAFLVDRYA
jgi:diacylglycerol kinase (ATP)